MRGTLPRVFLCLLSCDYAFAAANQDEQCDFNDGVVSCVCAEGGDIALSHIPSRAIALTIAECNRVRFEGAPFKGSTLHRLEIANSTSVRLPDFLGVNNIGLVELINLADLRIRSLYFLKTDRLEMRNVTIGALNIYAIPGYASIGTLRILDSIVGGFTNGSLHLRNASALEIIGCKLGVIESNAVAIENVSNFTIRKSEFILEEEAMSIMDVSEVLIDRNEIHTTTVASFLASSIGEFRVSNNNFRRAGAQTFLHMGDVGKVIIENNRFIQIDEQGLSLHPEGNILSVAVRNNKFSCDCNLFWLWRDRMQPQTLEVNSEFEKFLNSSFCDRPDALADLRLLEVMPLVRRESDECIRFEPINEVHEKRRYLMNFGRFRAVSAAPKVHMSLLACATLLIAIHANHS